MNHFSMFLNRLSFLPLQHTFAIFFIVMGYRSVFFSSGKPLSLRESLWRQPVDGSDRKETEVVEGCLILPVDG